MTLLEKIFQMEVEYVKLFSEVKEEVSALVFTDVHLPDMYNHNFSLYPSNDGLIEYINNELKKEEVKNKGFLRVVTHDTANATAISELLVKPEISTFDLMYIESVKYSEMQGNPNCSVLCADNNTVLDDGMKVDVLANQEAMGVDFAKRRIARKALEYKSLDKPIQLFVCYHEDRPVGNIEYIPFDDIVKLEDFDILEEYQRKGFGTTVLKHLLEKAYHDNIEYAYLITDSQDTAKEMYEKCGLKKIGEKTELFFRLK
ncbi:GNAT family N-acetyltransferase [Anaerobacillus alkaliphilus]|uniref:GNAT family N-acetyltransferase n=1 Tax=Anaerobacillus alkaliphilus TaxID=1548597 RepID=A0A4Q0VP98_9BACI|nr:GNAT family N-acetyltransferase [Anaerobacillus alkaliphilus]RXI96702.1 GNAT family N-acetyltransferase [Anaerobacillus alkaliphilus]